MIGIKGIKMPESCNSCLYCRDNGYLTAQCKLNNFETVEDLRNNKRDENCPLVDLGSEDMSWEELKGLAKDEIVFEHKEIGYFQIDSIFFSMQFFICGDIYFNDTKIFEDKKPFQMWQIINALTGDNKCQK